MNSEDIFKKNLNDQLAGKEFPFEEPEWDKMSALIDASKRKRRAFFWIFSGLLLLGGLTTVFLLSEKSTLSNKTLSQKENSLPRANEGQENISVRAGNSSAPSAQGTQGPHAESPKGSMPVETDSPIKPNAKPQPDKSIPEPLRVNPDEQEASENNAPVVKKNTPAPAVKTNYKTPPTNNSLPAVKEIAQPIIPAVTIKTAEEKTNQSAQEKNETKKMPVIAPGLNNETENKPSAKTPENPAIVSSKEESSNILPEQKAEAAILNAASNATGTTEHIASPLPQPLNNGAAAIDSLIAATAKPDTDYVKKKMPAIFIEGGANLLMGWKESAGRDGFGLSPLAGVHYGFNLGPGLKASIGVQYTNISHLKYSSYTAKVSRLDFGANSKVSTFTPLSAHYLMLPLRLHYSAGEKNTFGAGVSLAYLLTVNSKVEYYTQDVKGISDYTSTKETGYTQGFNNFDCQLSLFYQYRLMKRLAMNAELNFGLMDIKNGDHLPSNGKEHNTGLRLSLWYSLFKKD
jgi:hypothetical protein